MVCYFGIGWGGEGFGHRIPQKSLVFEKKNRTIRGGVGRLKKGEPRGRKVISETRAKNLINTPKNKENSDLK